MNGVSALFYDFTTLNLVYSDLVHTLDITWTIGKRGIGKAAGAHVFNLVVPFFQYIFWC